MPDLSELLHERAAELSVAPAGGFPDVERRARSAKTRRMALVAGAGSAVSVAAIAIGVTAASHRDGLSQQATVPPTAPAVRRLPPCPPPPTGLLGAGTPGPYGSGLGQAVAASLDGWSVSRPDPQTGDFPGCAASDAERARERDAHYPLANYDAVVGGRVQVEHVVGPTSVTIELITARYTPTITRADAVDIARGFVVQQTEQWQRMIETNPSPAPGDPTSATAALDPEAEGDTPDGGHWWIYRGQQNKFGFAWTPDGSLTVARMDPDRHTPEAERQLRDALLAAAAFQAAR